MTPQVADRNTGHGYVWERPDGMKARCGGPVICPQCALDYANFHDRPVDPVKWADEAQKKTGEMGKLPPEKYAFWSWTETLPKDHPYYTTIPAGAARDLFAAGWDAAMRHKSEVV
jgi:hypothetical protein